MRAALRLLVGLATLGAGALLALYGILLLVYTGDNGNGDTYIQPGGHKVDAHLAGGFILPLALGLFVLFRLVLRRRGRHSGRPVKGL
jgi:hypothetical protein